MDTETLNAVAVKLREAREQYDEARRRYEAARSEDTNALNALNHAQKSFDEAVSALRKDAPWNSEWHRLNKRSGHEAATV